MATKAFDQITIMDLTDAYSVILTQDSYIFQGDANSADPSQTHQFTTQVIAMRGADIIRATVVAANISPASGNPFTYSIDTTSNGTNEGRSPIITITLPAANADSVTVPGTIRIPVTVASGVVVDKDLAYSISYKGSTGTGISGHNVQYQASDSATTTPTGTWFDSIAETDWRTGQYLWTKTTIIYSDNTQTVSYSVSRDGMDGDAGRGIASTTVDYAVGTSGTTAPETGWQATIPTIEQGEYLWTRTTVTYTSGEPSISYSVALQGADGTGAIAVELTSSDGTLFKSTDATTTLTANVYCGGKQLDLVSIHALGAIKWYRNGVLQPDSNGSLTYVVTASDVSGSVIFEAKLEG